MPRPYPKEFEQAAAHSFNSSGSHSAKPVTGTNQTSIALPSREKRGELVEVAIVEDYPLM